MRPASTLRGSPSLAPVTAPRHACPRCHGRLVQLEEPTCLPCGWADYSLPGLTCRICREPLTGDRQRYCSTACVTLAGNRRKAQAARIRRGPPPLRPVRHPRRPGAPGARRGPGPARSPGVAASPGAVGWPPDGRRARGEPFLGPYWESPTGFDSAESLAPPPQFSSW